MDPQMEELLKSAEAISKLSPHEASILSFLKDGYSTRDIAQILHMSHKKVQAYRQSILDKLSARNTAHAVAMYSRKLQLEIHLRRH